MQLNHQETISKFSQISQKNSFSISFLLDGVILPENLGHFVRLSESLGLKKLYIAQPKIPFSSKFNKVSRNHNIEIITLDSIERFIFHSESIQFIVVEITTTSIPYFTFPFNTKKEIVLILGSEKY
jgi:tRNA G18 (ribose-2'-O)-methylase SpoU